jgi:hypothetical protein
MPHQKAPSEGIPKAFDTRPFVWRIIAPWILFLLTATWPKETHTDKPRNQRS